MAEHCCLQPRELVAAAGSAGRDRRLVADQRAAAAGEDRRADGQACTVLLADAGGRAHDARAVRSDASADRDAAASGKLTTGGIEHKSNRRESVRREKCRRNRWEMLTMTHRRPRRHRITQLFNRRRASWFCKTSYQRYNSGESELKKEIPA